METGDMQRSSAVVRLGKWRNTCFLRENESVNHPEQESDRERERESREGQSWRRRPTLTLTLTLSKGNKGRERRMGQVRRTRRWRTIGR